jgi:hypothetical protein
MRARMQEGRETMAPHDRLPGGMDEGTGNAPAGSYNQGSLRHC